MKELAHEQELAHSNLAGGGGEVGVTRALARFSYYDVWSKFSDIRGNGSVWCSRTLSSARKKPGNLAERHVCVAMSFKIALRLDRF